MATGRRKFPLDSLWIFALILLLVLTVWWLPGRGASGRRDSFSASRSGKKLFYDMVDRLHPDVDRELNRLLPGPTVDTYLLLGPSRYPNEAEWTDLYDWVASGHTLIFAAKWEDPAIDLYPFPVRIRPNVIDEVLESLGAEEEILELPIYPGLESERPVWRSKGMVVVDDFTEISDEEDEEFGGSYDAVDEDEGSLLDSAEMLVLNSGIQAASLPIGSGYLIVCATDDPFTNEAVRGSASAILATRILESGVVVGPISFGEHLNRSGSPGGFRLLFDPDLRPFTLQLLIFLVLFLWATARRFGPSEPNPPGRRRATSEHARALGELYLRRNHGTHVLARYLDYARERSGLSPNDKVVALFDEANDLVQSPSLDNRAAASMIRKLAQHFDPQQGT